MAILSAVIYHLWYPVEMEGKAMRRTLLWALLGTIAFTCSIASADWNTYQGNASHNGYVGGNLPVAHQVLWSTLLPGGNLNDLAVGGGNVYVSAQSYFGPATAPGLFALNAKTGTTQWTHAFGSVFSVNAPSYYNGTVYLQAGKGTQSPDPTFYAFNAATGSTNFNSTFSAQWERYLSPTIVNGRAFLNGGYYGGMYSYNASSGQQIWFGSVPQYDGWTPSVAGNYCYAFTGSGSTSPVTGKFTILDFSTGSTVSVSTDPGYSWTGYTMNQAPALGSNNDAFVTNGNRLLKFGTTASGGLLQVLTGSYYNQPSVGNGMVFVANGSRLTALSETTGSTLWNWSSPDGSNPLGPSIITDNLLFTSTAGNVYALNPVTGQTLWNEHFGGNLALSDAVLYVASASGTVTAIAVPEPQTATLVVFLIPMLLLGRPSRAYGAAVAARW